MASFFMNIEPAPFLAILGIILPLGLAYAILFFQPSWLDYSAPKKLAATGDELPQERAKLSRAEKKQAVRLMKHWLF